MSKPRALGTPWLILRHVTSGVGASVTVAVIVFLISAIAVGAPRAVQSLVTASVQYTVNALPVIDRDISADASPGPATGPSSTSSNSEFSPEVEAVWGKFEDTLDRVEEDMPAALAAGVADADYALTLPPAGAVADRTDAPDTQISLGFDPRILNRVDIVEGKEPAAATKDLPSDEPVQIMISSEAADLMDWSVGEKRQLMTTVGLQPVELAGIYEAKNKDDPYWQHIPATLHPSIEIVGLAPPVYVGVGYAHAASWEHSFAPSSGARLHVWFSTQTEKLTGDNAAAFSTAFREFTRLPHMIAGDMSYDEWFAYGTVFPAHELSFTTQVTQALDEAVATTSVTSAVLAMTASGPIGVILAVLILGAKLVIDRRAAGLRLAAARGASRAQLRTVLAIEGLAIGAPAAILGAIVGLLLTPTSTSMLGIALAAVVGLTPAVMLASSGAMLGMRKVRSDLTPRGAGAWRWIAEIVILAGAGLATFLLLRRGLTTSATQTGVDPLLASTPLLLALAACVLVMRIYPIPLAGLWRFARVRSGLVAFLGAARGLRDPAAGLAPILAMVVGISVAVFSGVMLTTVATGVTDSARAAIGADLIVAHPALTKAQAKAISEVAGVEATAPVYAEMQGTLVYDGERDFIGVLVVDAAELRKVQHGGSGAIEIPASFSESGGASIPVIASDTVAERLIGASKITMNKDELTVVGTAASEGPQTSRRTWIIVDTSNAEALLGQIYSPSRIFVDLEPGAHPDQVKAAIRAALPDNAEVQVPADIEAQLNGKPAVTGLQVALIGAMLLISFLCTVAVIMTLARGAASRERLLAMLRTVGLSRHQSSAVVAWELAPMAMVALIGGSALGLLLPAVVLAGVDLRLFTGATTQPEIAIDPLLTLLVSGGFVALVVLSTAVAVIATRRINPANALRTIEE